MEEFNLSAFLFINQYAGKNSTLDLALINIAEIMPYILMLIMVCLWFNANIENKRASFNAGLCVLLGMLSSYVISFFYYHPRPFVDNLGTQLIEHAPDSSFPSDHTTFIFSISVMLLFNKSTRVLGVVLCGFSLISGLSRVFAGIHFPLDILSAILVAIFSSMVVFKFQSKANSLFAWLVYNIQYKKITNSH